MADRRFKHGSKRTWELAVDAIADLGGKASASQILARIQQRIPDYVQSNLLADLSTVSVNSPSRGQYAQNSHPRRTDSGSEFDRVFKHGFRTSVSYELYEPARHGIWEIYVDTVGKAKVREVIIGMVERELAAARGAAETRNAFDPTDVEDARQRIFGAIARRQGQPKFRLALLKSYQGRCAITGCAVEQVLEAAHIHPYRGSETNVASNGLLLRADIHTLFDLGLIRVDHATFQVAVSSLLQGTEYAELASRRLALPAEASDHPSREAFRWHSSQFAELPGD